MTILPPRHGKRILAIDPTRRGFGFAIFDGPGVLVDWGLKRAKGESNHVRRAAELIRRYQPEVMVVERTSASACRRRQRARRAIKNLLVLARDHHVRVRQVSRQSVQRCFGADGPATKRQVAVALAARFPELGRHLPPERKPWMPENERMGIFDAAAFGWKFYEPLRRERRALALLEEPSALSNA